MEKKIKYPFSWEIFGETFYVIGYSEKKIYINRYLNNKYYQISRTTLNKRESTLNILLNKIDVESDTNVIETNIKEAYPEYFI